MSDQANYNDVEINLPEFFWKLLEQWKLILLFAIVCACAIGGVKFYSDSVNSNIEVKEEAVSVDELAEKLTDEERQAVDYAMRVRESLDNFQNYMNEAYLMQIDAYHEDYLSCTFYINNTSGMTPDKVSLVCRDYLSYFNDEEFATGLAQEMGWTNEEGRVSELITPILASLTPSTGDNSEYDAIVLRIILPDSDTSGDKVASAITDLIANYDIGIQDVTDYTLDLVTYNQAVVVDSETASRQATNIAALDSRQTALKTLEDKLEGDSKTLYELYTSSEEDTEAQGVSPTKKAGFSKKYVVLGGIAGIILYAGLLLLWYYINPKVGKITGMDGILPDRNAGFICYSKKVTGLKVLTTSAFVDGIRNRDKRSVAEQSEEVLSAIEFMAGSSDVDMESISYLYLSSISNELKSLVSENIKGKYVEIPEDRESTYRVLSGIENAVLLFEEEKTPVSKVREIVRLLTKNKSNIVAYIVLG